MKAQLLGVACFWCFLPLKFELLHTSEGLFPSPPHSDGDVHFCSSRLHLNLLLATALKSAAPSAKSRCTPREHFGCRAVILHLFAVVPCEILQKLQLPDPLMNLSLWHRHTVLLVQQLHPAQEFQIEHQPVVPISVVCNENPVFHVITGCVTWWRHLRVNFRLLMREVFTLEGDGKKKKSLNTIVLWHSVIWCVFFFPSVMYQHAYSGDSRLISL